jgi:uncharacterized protein (TIGR00730 family)
MSGPVVSESDETVNIVESALANLWSVVNELSRVRPPRRDRYRVTIFGSARATPGDPIYGEARELARQLAAMGCDIVTGGGPGLMQAANEGEALGDPDHRTESHGIRIELPFEQGANPFVEKVYTHRTFFSRLHQFMRLSSAFIVLPGGIGTALETFLVWQLLQVRHVTDVPLIFVGPMWRDLVAWAGKHMVEGPVKLASAEDIAVPTCVATAAEAVQVVAQHRARVGAAAAIAVPAPAPGGAAPR